MTVDKAKIRREHRHRSYLARARNTLVLLVDNVDKSRNVGGILRLADAFLLQRVACSSDKPDYCGAMGAEHWQPAAWGVDLQAEVLEHRRRGYAVVALEQSPQASPIDKFEFPASTVLIVGAEMFGVSDELLRLSDAAIYIPQAGLVKSLNVVSATAIALYEYSRQHWMVNHEQSSRHLAPASQSLRLEDPERFNP